MAYFLDEDLAELVRTEQSRKGRSGFNTGGGFRKSSAPAAKGSGGGNRKNMYPAPCSKCGVKVGKGEGTVAHTNGAWVTTHLDAC